MASILTAAAAFDKSALRTYSEIVCLYPASVAEAVQPAPRAQLSHSLLLKKRNFFLVYAFFMIEVARVISRKRTSLEHWRVTIVHTLER